MKTLLLALFAFGASALGETLTLSINTPVTYPSGSPTVNCQTSGTAPCIVYTGTIADGDTDGSVITLNDILITFLTPGGSTYFTQDNTFFDNVPGILTAGDSYSGPLFALDFPANTPPGDYQFTALVEATDGNGVNFDSASAGSDAQVTPEPASGLLRLAALPAAFALRRRLKG